MIGDVLLNRKENKTENSTKERIEMKIYAAVLTTVTISFVGVYAMIISSLSALLTTIA